jgi:hypothetical protein
VLFSRYRVARQEHRDDFLGHKFKIFHVPLARRALLSLPYRMVLLDFVGAIVEKGVAQLQGFFLAGCHDSRSVQTLPAAEGGGILLLTEYQQNALSLTNRQK